LKKIKELIVRGMIVKTAELSDKENSRRLKGAILKSTNISENRKNLDRQRFSKLVPKLKVENDEMLDLKVDMEVKLIEFLNLKNRIELRNNHQKIKRKGSGVTHCLGTSKKKCPKCESETKKWPNPGGLKKTILLCPRCGWTDRVLPKFGEV
jgi:DnaJ-class molecular chaperone